MEDPERPNLGWMINVGTAISLGIMLTLSLLDRFVIRGEPASADWLQSLIIMAAATGAATASLIAAAAYLGGLGRR